MVAHSKAGRSSQEVPLSPVAPDAFSPRGVYAPTITAFEKNEDVSLPGTRAFVRFLLAQGVDGLVPLGSSGEPLSLTIDERKAILEAVTEEAGGKVPIMAGIVCRDRCNRSRRTSGGRRWLDQLFAHDCAQPSNFPRACEAVEGPAGGLGRDLEPESIG
jgi:hypothetical protein